MLVETALLEVYFELSITLGGRLEQDFTREPESSYNPRPARVAQILLEDCSINDPLALAASFLCALGERATEELRAAVGPLSRQPR